MQDEDNAGEIRILMLDDSREDFILTQVSFDDGQDFRHSMDWSPDIADALLKTKASRYDILIVDYRLKEKDGKTGLDFVETIRKNGNTTPAILLTGIDMKKIPAEKCTPLGISRCISKHEKDPNLFISIILDTVLHFRKD